MTKHIFRATKQRQEKKERKLFMRSRVFWVASAFILTMLPICAFELNSNWVVVVSKNASPTEQRAASEIVKYVNAISGLQLETAELLSQGRKAITVKAAEKYSTEAWFVCGDSAGITVSGGLPNGILYAAYTFIEDVLGCEFLTFDCEYIPKLAKIELPEHFEFAAKPYFTGRHIYTSGNALLPEFRRFLVKRKMNSNFLSLDYGWYDRSIANLNCHSFHRYSVAFPKDKPELFSMDTKGNRLRSETGGGPGQLCLSNPETRDLTFEEMKKIIAADRLSVSKNYAMPHSLILDVSANDNNNKCVCPGCLLLEEKYGGRYSGVLLDFINDLAERVEKVYPGTIIQTFAYQFTEEIPRGIEPRSNVLVQIAQLGGEFSESVSARDSLRSLHHPNNAKALKLTREWASLGKELKMWDYWILYTQTTLFPATNIAAIAPNLKVYAENNVTRIFSENEGVGNSNFSLTANNFADLGIWLGTKLMVDPQQEAAPLIEKFMHLYYGPAAKPMTELLSHIEKAMEKEPGNLGIRGIASCYLDKPFFDTAELLFSEAEKLAGGEAKLLERIGYERIRFDFAALALQKRINLEFDKKQMIDRLQKNYEAAVLKYILPESQQKGREVLQNKFNLMREELPLPEQFTGRNVWDFPWYKITKPWCTHWVEDTDAAGGKAVSLTGVHASRKTISEGFHSRELEFGLYDTVDKVHLLSKKIPRSQMPLDEKYHWYELGRSKLALKTWVWAHWSWWIQLNCGNEVFDALSPTTEYDIWLSIKLQGPSYVPGSKKEDALLIDRLIFVR
jgi:hypothetical protein